jgi:succinate dehydrogenase/fumarate reductase-like Fe-S protein
MEVNISRNGRIHSYEVPGNSTTINITQVLDYIYERLDHSLAYYRHSACCQGICGRCVVKADGKNVLACTAKVEPGTEKLLLEPAGGSAVRDLVIEN